jgi:cytochrome c biogenesis factor
MIYIGYTNFLVFMLVLTGILIIRFDVKIYEYAKLKKEQKVAKWLGWTNVLLGGLIFGANWVYQNFLW